MNETRAITARASLNNEKKPVRTTYVDLSSNDQNNMQTAVEQMLSRLIAGDEKLRELLVQTT